MTVCSCVSGDRVAVARVTVAHTHVTGARVFSRCVTDPLLIGAHEHPSQEDP